MALDYKQEQDRWVATVAELTDKHVDASNKLSDLGKEVAKAVEVLRSIHTLSGQPLMIQEITSGIIDSVKESESLEVGLTERIRQILQAQPTAAFQPTDVRTSLEAAKFDLSKYSNAMAAIHVVLKRLVDQTQALLKQTADGKPAYQWNPAAVVKK